MRKLFLVLFLLLSAAAYGQNVRYDNIAFKPSGKFYTNANIAVCQAGANTGVTPCNPLATIYTGQTSTTPASNPFTTDQYGNYGFWALPGHYLVQIYGGGIQTQVYDVFIPCDPTTACTTSGSVIGMFFDKGGAVFNPKAYGAKGDGQVVTDGAITSSQAILTSATGLFKAADVGKDVVVFGAGAAGATLSTTVLSFQSSTQVTLSANASTTVTAARTVWGTDDTAAFTTTFAAAGTVAGTVAVPAGIYMISSSLAWPAGGLSPFTLRGAGVSNFTSTIGTMIQATGALNPILDIKDDGSSVFDLTIDGANLATTGVLMHTDRSFSSGHATNETLNRVHIQDIAPTGTGLDLGVANALKGCSDCSFHEVGIFGPIGTGIAIVREDNQFYFTQVVGATVGVNFVAGNFGGPTSNAFYGGVFSGGATDITTNSSVTKDSFYSFWFENATVGVIAGIPSGSYVDQTFQFYDCHINDVPASGSSLMDFTNGEGSVWFNRCNFDINGGGSGTVITLPSTFVFQDTGSAGTTSITFSGAGSYYFRQYVANSGRSALFSSHYTYTQPSSNANVELFDDVDTGTPALMAKSNGTGTLAFQTQGESAFNAVGINFIATPVFDASLGNVQSETLTGNVTSSTLTNCFSGAVITLTIIEDATGGHTFVSPTTMGGFGTIVTTAHEVNAQTFLCTGGTGAVAITQMYSYAP